jgi:hypothetical protein
VDNNNYIASKSLDGSGITDMNAISMQAKIPNLVPVQHYVFARIGVKISGVDDMIFSRVVKVNF